MYTTLNGYIEKLPKISFILAINLTVGSILPIVLVTLVNYFIYNLHEESFILPAFVMYGTKLILMMIYDKDINKTRKSYFYLFRLPFDWRKPLGYAIALSAQCTAIYFTLYCSIPVVTLFIGSCRLSICIVEDITNDLTLLIIDHKTKRKTTEIESQLRNLVQFYMDAKTFSIFLFEVEVIFSLICINKFGFIEDSWLI